jgi:DnaK suppressor protein
LSFPTYETGIILGENMEMQSRDRGRREKSLRRFLLTKRAEIEARIRKELGKKITKDFDSARGSVLDLGDLITLDLERDLDYELLTMNAAALKDINEALKQLDEGTYGICKECGEEIGEKRLQAVPFALYCLECQREKERLRWTAHGELRMERLAHTEDEQADREHPP